jgi:hypothetical protein
VETLRELARSSTRTSRFVSGSSGPRRFMKLVCEPALTNFVHKLVENTLAFTSSCTRAGLPTIA